MKNFILSIAIIAGFAACNSSAKQDDARDIRLLSDPASYNSSVYSDTPVTAKPDPIPAIGSQEPKVVTVRERIIYRTAPVKNTAPVYEPPVNSPDVAATVPTPGTNTDNNSVQTGNGTVDDETASTTTQAEKKKGWSSAAKGAAIGAGAGAIGGAIIAKKKGLGAIVGGVVGAAGGYIIGKDIDKRKAGN
jgi:hypothetical protein